MAAEMDLDETYKDGDRPEYSLEIDPGFILTEQKESRSWSISTT